MAATRQFTASEGEMVREVLPGAVRIWKVVEGGRTVQSEVGKINILTPGILISPLDIESTIGRGLNCADDEVHPFVIQIVDSAPGPAGHSTPIRTYLEWISLIRAQLLTVPNPFLQDADPEVYDPFVVHIRRKIPASPPSLVRHEQQVASLAFQVTVRNHR
jgi:hypothetical protein